MKDKKSKKAAADKKADKLARKKKHTGCKGEKGAAGCKGCARRRPRDIRYRRSATKR